MDETFLVEIRLGKTKWRAKQIVSRIDRSFGIRNHIELHPHITLSGPFTLKEGITPARLLDAIERAASQTGPVPFMLDGWDTRRGMSGGVIAFRVVPSDALKKLTTSLSRELGPIIATSNTWDADPDAKWYHVTIANRLDAALASSIFSGLSREVTPRANPPHPAGFIGSVVSLFRRFFVDDTGTIRPMTVDDAGLRITVLKGDSILAEFDLLQKRWITDHRHDHPSWQRTLALYRFHAGFELVDPCLPSPEEIFVIADLHLGHANIIRYCSRPFFFPDVDEMDQVLIKNWNYTIAPKNRVYYLGDLRYGRHPAPAEVYMKRLRGKITYIHGNHDSGERGGDTFLYLSHRNFHFCLVHDPADVPADFDGWIVHGHHHNNDLRRFPFINFELRRINVSAEVLGYIPVSLDHICDLLDQRLSGSDRSPILLAYFCSSG